MCDNNAGTIDIAFDITPKDFLISASMYLSPGDPIAIVLVHQSVVPVLGTLVSRIALKVRCVFRLWLEHESWTSQWNP